MSFLEEIVKRTEDGLAKQIAIFKDMDNGNYWRMAERMWEYGLVQDKIRKAADQGEHSIKFWVDNDLFDPPFYHWNTYNPFTTCLELLIREQGFKTEILKRSALHHEIIISW